jgi:hypothetical protein
MAKQTMIVAGLFDLENCNEPWALSQVLPSQFERLSLLWPLTSRSIHWFLAMTVIAGMIIGSGIFSTPSGILISVGSVGMSLFIWVIAAVASFCGVLAYLELGSVS